MTHLVSAAVLRQAQLARSEAQEAKRQAELAAAQQLVEGQFRELAGTEAVQGQGSEQSTAATAGGSKPLSTDEQVGGGVSCCCVPAVL